MSMPKIAFVPRHKRNTLISEIEKEKEEERLRKQDELLRAKVLEESVTVVTQDGVVENKEELGDYDDVIDDVYYDEQHDDDEFELWKEREAARSEKMTTERNEILRIREETKKRSALKDYEIQKEKESANPERYKEKTKYNFLQRYYHKGGFYQDDEESEIMNRDYNQPTGEDIVDKNLLPSVMRVKKYGLSGRSKYTHLADQDTTREKGGEKGIFYEKEFGGGGARGGFDRPSKRSRRS